MNERVPLSLLVPLGVLCGVILGLVGAKLLIEDLVKKLERLEN